MAHDCGNCGGCTGGCAGCGGCRGALELNAGELEMLDALARIPFLPVARRADSEDRPGGCRGRGGDTEAL